LLPIYAAREENTFGVSSEQLAEALSKRGTPAKVFLTKEGVVVEVKENTKVGDVILVMGAGDVTQVASQLVQ
jgi:UDP-N-acetylmuramate--alanine ligase